jgi:hypothetical protein
MNDGYALLSLVLLAAGLFLAPLAAQAQTAPGFELPITAADNANAYTVTIGMDAAATDGFDTGIDQVVPPPSFGLDARITNGPNGLQDLTKDIRASTTDPITFELAYQAADGQGPLVLSWDPSELPSTVQAVIVETGQSLNATSSLDTSTDGAVDGGLTIEVDVVTPPAAPSTLGASPSSTAEIALSWTDNADDEANVEVETSSQSSGGPFGPLATLGADATTYSHTGLAPNSEHCYRVRTTNVAGNSAWSNVACATTPAGTLAFDPAQVALAAEEGGADQISLTITASPSAAGSVSLVASEAWLGVPASVQTGTAFTVTADAASLTEGTYTGTVTGSAPDFADATLTVELTVAPTIITDFVGELTVTDDNGTAKTLTFGTSPDATDGVDPLYDQKAPPLPPDGAFDARFNGPTADLYDDFRATNTGEVAWTVQFTPANGGAPVTLNWDPGALPTDGRFVLTGPDTEIDMRAQTSYTVTDLTVEKMTLAYSLTSLVDLSVSGGWNLVGLPLDALDKGYQSVFAALTPQQAPFWFDGTYVPEDVLAMGKGYWLDAPTGGTQSIEGYDVTSVTVSLNAGWNLIAGPSCAAPLASVDDPSGVIDPSTLYGFDQVYAAATTVEAGAGYWVEAAGAGDVTLSCAGDGTTNALAAATTDAAADHAVFTVRSASGAEQTLRVGPSVPGRSYALPPLPPGGAFDARFDDGTRLLSETDGRIRLQGAQFPLTIALAEARDGTADGGYLIEALADRTPVGEYRLTEAGDGVEIHDPAVTALRVARRAGGSMPSAFALRGNAPNPFGTTTRVVFDLPETATVTMEVYDMLGRRLFVHEEQVAAGAGRSLQVAGTPFPSGNYFYRLRAEMSGKTTVKTGRFSVVR